MQENFYNKVQKDQREAGGYYKEKIDFILKEVGKRKKVLDVGCNDGFFGEFLLKNDNDVYGFDIVEENLKVAKSKGLKVKKFDIDEDEWPYPSNSFDVVVLGDVIEHIFDTDKLLRNCNRVLKKNGKIIITTPNIASLGRRLLLLLGISPFIEYSLELTTNGYPSVGHIRYYTVNTLKTQLGHNGFKPSLIEGDNFNLVFLKSRLLGKKLPSFATMLMCSALKKKAIIK